MRQAAVVNEKVAISESNRSFGLAHYNNRLINSTGVSPYQVEEKIRNEILPWLENMSPEEKSKWERFYLEMSGGKITLEDVKDDLIRYVKEAKEYNKKEEEE